MTNGATRWLHAGALALAVGRFAGGSAAAAAQPLPGTVAGTDLGSPEAELDRPIGARIGARFNESLARPALGLSIRRGARVDDRPDARAPFRPCPGCAGTAENER